MDMYYKDIVHGSRFTVVGPTALISDIYNFRG